MSNVKTYIIRCGDTDLYKIGFAKSPINRVNTLQIGNPFILHFRMIIQGNKEYTLHSKFYKQRVRGEWFLIDYNDLWALEIEYKSFIVDTKTVDAYNDLYFNLETSYSINKKFKPKSILK